MTDRLTHIKLTVTQLLYTSDGTAEAEALTWDLFGWKRKRKQLNQTASASRYYIDHTVLQNVIYFQPLVKTRKYELNWTYG